MKNALPELSALDFAEGVLYAPRHAAWVRLPSGSGSGGSGSGGSGPGPGVPVRWRVGAVPSQCRGRGEVVGARMLPAPNAFDAGYVIAHVEFREWVQEVSLPFAGRIVACNAALRFDPAPLGRDPFGAGWLVDVEPADPAGAEAALVGRIDALRALSGIPLGRLEVRARVSAGRAHDAVSFRDAESGVEFLTARRVDDPASAARFLRRWRPRDRWELLVEERGRAESFRAEVIGPEVRGGERVQMVRILRVGEPGEEGAPAGFVLHIREDDGSLLRSLVLSPDGRFAIRTADNPYGHEAFVDPGLEAPASFLTDWGRMPEREADEERTVHPRARSGAPVFQRRTRFFGDEFEHELRLETGEGSPLVVVQRWEKGGGWWKETRRECGGRVLGRAVSLQRSAVGAGPGGS